MKSKIQIRAPPSNRKVKRSRKTDSIWRKRMIYMYEKACKDAGLSEERTAEIRRFFDAENKRLRYWKKMRFDYYMGQTSFEDFLEQNPGMEPSSEEKVEDEIILKMNLSKLKDLMEEMDEDDKIFLLRCFDGTSERELAESLGMTGAKVRRKRDAMISQLREKFGVDN